MKTKTSLNYSAISEEISDWLTDYVRKSNTNGFVMGVSGGIDSAVVSTLCARTGMNLLVLEMPIHQGTAEVDRAKNHIQWLKDNFNNVISKEINLTKAYDVLYNEYANNSKGVIGAISTEDFDFSMANTRSRLRMTTLYQYAGMNKMLVAGTGNKVEDFGIGFYTKYGDGGVDISPIADLMKSEVYALGAELGIHNDILTAAPTDGLHDDARTDEEQIGASYDELEWAMYWISEHTIVEQNVNPWYDDTEDRSLDNRQRDVIEIYKKFHNSNKHKMGSIPVFDCSKFRN